MMSPLDASAKDGDSPPPRLPSSSFEGLLPDHREAGARLRASSDERAFTPPERLVHRHGTEGRAVGAGVIEAVARSHHVLLLIENVDERPGLLHDEGQ